MLGAGPSSAAKRSRAGGGAGPAGPEAAEPSAATSARLVAEADRRAEAAEAEAQAQRCRASALEADMAALRLRAQVLEARDAASSFVPGDGTGADGGGGAAYFLLGSATVETPTRFMTPARIVELLCTGGRSAQIAVAACGALQSIAANKTSGGEACVAADAVPALVAALKSHSSVKGVAMNACSALRYIAIIPAGGEACAAAGAVPAILAALQSHPSVFEVAEAACGALRIISVIPAGGEACVAAGAVPAILAALKSHPIMVNTCDILLFRLGYNHNGTKK